MMILWAWCSNATTYFIDFVGGSDAANGTSSVTPWQHCPGDSAATGNSSATTFAAGDTVIFKGGINYPNTVSWKGNGGTVASPIIVDGNTAGTFGTGKAVFNGQDVKTLGLDFTVAFAYRNTHTIQFSNIIVQGFQFTRYGGHGTWNPANITWNCATTPSTINGQGIWIEGAANMRVSSCLFTNIGDWTNAPNMDGSFASGDGIKVDQYCQSLVFTTNEFTQCGHSAIWLGTVNDNDWITNCWIGSNSFHNFIQWSVLLTPNGNTTTFNGLYITNNVFANRWEYSPNQWVGCVNGFPHTDGIFCFFPSLTVNNVTLGTTASPLRICNNICFNNVSYTNQGGTAWLYLSDFAGRVEVFNNVIINALNMGEGGIYMFGSLDFLGHGDTPIDYEVYNNSFFDQTFGIVMASQSQLFALTNGTVKIKNNLFYHTVSTNFALPVTFGSDAWSKPTELDYNGYFTIRNDQIINTSWSGVQTFNTFAQLQALGFESHGFYGDPKYVNISQGLGTTSSQNDLHIQVTSPAKGTGVNLSSLFTTDFNGNTRGSTWDMGAFAFAGGTTPGMIMNLSVLRAGNTFIK